MGFYLLLLLCGGIAVALAGVTVPSLFGRRAAHNEEKAIATLRAIAVAQKKFHDSGVLDVDEDRNPEFGSLGELGALVPLRDGGKVRLGAKLLSEGLATPDEDGHVMANGYYFAVYLPDRDGNGVVGSAANLGRVDARLAHRYWTCLAWPVEAGTTGHRTFFINQEGRILKTLRPVYSGKDGVPPPGAALVTTSAEEIRSANLGAGVRAADGRAWTELE